MTTAYSRGFVVGFVVVGFCLFVCGGFGFFCSGFINKILAFYVKPGLLHKISI